MKLQTTVDFSESQKAQIVARGEVPAGRYTFEMSQKYAAIFPKLQGSYRVFPDLIASDANVNTEGYRDAKQMWIDQKYIHQLFQDAIAAGTLKDGASCDLIMQEIEKLLDAKDAARQAAQEKAEEDAARQERERPAKEAQEARDGEAHDRRIAEEREKEAKETAARKAKHEADQQEKMAWIEAQGSERLKKGIAARYHCQKIYVTERGLAELGDAYILDYDEDVATKDRSCPTLEALNEVERLTKSGIKARVKWLPNGTATEEDCYDYQCDLQQSCEAVEAIFLGSYFYLEIA